MAYPWRLGWGCLLAPCPVTHPPNADRSEGCAILLLVKPTALLLIAFSLLVAQKPKEPIRSTVFEWTRLTAQKTANGERRSIADGPSATMTNFESHVTTLDGGKPSHAPHRHHDEEIVIVKEGTLEVTINGKTETAGPGSMVFFASNDLHGLKNAGATRASYYVIRIVTTAK